jgi:uncharacterized membrane protein
MPGQHETTTQEPSREDADERRQRITEVGVGITLVGVIVNMGLTIGFGLGSSPLYVRLPLAFTAPVLLVGTLAYLTRRMRLLSTIPWWLTKPGPDPWQHLTGDDEPHDGT